MNPQVDQYLQHAKHWQKEMELLRLILLDCPVTEHLKWSKPCYCWEDKNIVVIQGFKAYCAVLFFKGYLLKDPQGLLVKTGENTIVGRQLRFVNVKEVIKLAPALKAFALQPIDIEKSGPAKPVQKKTTLKFPIEFQNILTEKPALKTAFGKLTPGRQRAYLIHFSQPVQAKTRESRIEKCIDRIMKGKGLIE